MKNTPVNLSKGKYIAQIKAMKQDVDEPSAMAPYLAETVIITNETSQNFITLMIQKEEIITGFQLINNENQLTDSIDQKIDEQANIRYEIFQLDELQTILTARVQYEINHEGEIFKGDEPLRLFIDSESIQNVDSINLDAE